jgi:hypothetical protein
MMLPAKRLLLRKSGRVGFRRLLTESVGNVFIFARVYWRVPDLCQQSRVMPNRGAQAAGDDAHSGVRRGQGCVLGGPCFQLPFRKPAMLCRSRASDGWTDGREKDDGVEGAKRWLMSVRREGRCEGVERRVGRESGSGKGVFGGRWWYVRPDPDLKGAARADQRVILVSGDASTASVQWAGPSFALHQAAAPTSRPSVHAEMKLK